MEKTNEINALTKECIVTALLRLMDEKDYYDITSVVPYNMFPQTKHIETLVCLQRRV